MIREEVFSKEIIGKTIDGLHYSVGSDVMMLTFDDGTLAVFEVMAGYEQGDEEICAGDLDLLTFGDATLIEAGVITEEDLKAHRIKRVADWKKAQEAGDRRRYLALKKKFEPTATSEEKSHPDQPSATADLSVS
ncbi:MAG: hypothetical protein KAJ19_22820 [Gammaproteobacteria bacterium]|nr:hypothetical protein [Gammaproteobacteria bacterium]